MKSKKQAGSEPRKPRRNAASKPKEIPSPDNDSDRPAQFFPVVGIGSSAGGLEALELFLGNVPKGCGFAVVIIQHMDPTHTSMMVELLQRASMLPVVQAEDRLPVEPDHVYVIPPNKDMSILHGALHLFDPVVPRGFRLPIDFFFRSLADDRQEKSIGVLLSGMGSDGTLGLRAIKEKGGAAFVQSPDSAKFDGMPRSAIDAEFADVVAPVEELPGRIIAFLQHAPRGVSPEAAIREKTESAIQKIFILLRARTGHDFSLYKKTTVSRRIERRMSIHQIDRIDAYVRFLQENPQELDLLFKELLIGVTRFFRDAQAWEKLKENIILELLAGRSPGGVLRAWIPGCSTGEEAFSLAITFKEAVEKMKPGQNFSLQIFATDLDRDAVEKARTGVYPANIAADVSADRLRRFFVKEEENYRVGKEIRDTVLFAPQNVIMDPPFTKLDLLICRNMLIYLDSELQKKLIPLFHYSLNPGGILFLGSAETIGTHVRLFSTLDGEARIYRRIDTLTKSDPMEFPTFFFPSRRGWSDASIPQSGAQKPIPNIQALADQFLLMRYSPAAVLVTDKGDIVYVSGRTGKYLEPAAGKANWNIAVMAREGLRYELSGALQQALLEKATVVLKGLSVGTNGGVQGVDVTVQPIEEPSALQGMAMIVFRDVEIPARTKQENKKSCASALQHRLSQLERELQQSRAELQSKREEFISMNEEFHSTNEELQSANEELTSSKEEMQSLNEELQTVNHELQAKLEELSSSNNDMKNLLNSTDIATLFLDDALHVRRFTSPLTKIMRLIPSDIGRPITDISSELLYPELTQDVEEVLRILAVREKQIASKDGSWFTIRIMPYRTLENRIEGVVITFLNITASKFLEAELRRQVRTGEVELIAEKGKGR